MESVMALVAIVGVIGLVFVLPIKGILDAKQHPDQAWAAIGAAQRTWTILMACSLVFFLPVVSLVGICSSGIYWVSKRPRLVAAERQLSRSVAPSSPMSRRI
jgi:hypothetical protein